MSHNNAAAVIHIDETLNDAQIHNLEYNLSQQQGVTASCINDKTRHLIVVDYDPQKTASNTLLHNVCANGYHAELIGGI